MNSSGDVSVGTVEARESRRGLLAGILSALVISVALNVLLAHKVQKVTALESARIVDRLLKVGTSVQPILAKRLDGQQELIAYDQSAHPTLLYVFTPACGWCARNLDNFKTLVARESSGYRIVALSLSDAGLAEYVAKNELNVPVYSGLTPETLKAYKLGGTPQTIVVSRDGRVLQNWPGAYVGEQQKQIEAFFQVKLPGLRPAPSPRAPESRPSQEKN